MSLPEAGIGGLRERLSDLSTCLSKSEVEIVRNAGRAGDAPDCLPKGRAAAGSGERRRSQALGTCKSRIPIPATGPPVPTEPDRAPRHRPSTRERPLRLASWRVFHSSSPMGRKRKKRFGAIRISPRAHRRRPRSPGAGFNSGRTSAPWRLAIAAAGTPASRPETPSPSAARPRWIGGGPPDSQGKFSRYLERHPSMACRIGKTIPDKRKAGKSIPPIPSERARASETGR